LEALQTFTDQNLVWDAVGVQEGGAGLGLDLGLFSDINSKCKIYGNSDLSENIHGLFLVINLSRDLRVEWYAQREKAVAAIVKRNHYRVLVINAYFRHSGHSLDEYQHTIDDISSLIQCNPYKGARIAVLCDANVHLGPGAGPYVLADGWSERARTLSVFMDSLGLVAANVSEKLTRAENQPLWTLRATGAQVTYHQNDYIFIKQASHRFTRLLHDIVV